MIRTAGACALAVSLLLPARSAAQALATPAASPAMPPPQFMDPARATKLASGFAEVEQILRAYAERAHIPGFAFGILVDGKLAYARGFGWREVPGNLPVDTDTVFRIASMTKSFTAVAILKLRDEGRLGLDDPAAKYVPELAGLAYPTLDSAPITIRQLLSHSEGFPEDNPWGDRQLAATDAEFSAMLRGGIPFSTPPGTAFEYSNYGFAILGRIVSRVSGMPYSEYVTASILRPLGMTSTTFEAGSVPAGRLALGYRWEDDRWKAEPMLADGAFGAMGGLLTSINDLARYVGFNVSAWPASDLPERGPIRRSSAREMQQAARATAPVVTRDRTAAPLRVEAGAYAFGLNVTERCRPIDSGVQRLARMVSHGGGLPGFGSFMAWLPDHGVGIVVLGNRTYAGWRGAVDRAFDALARTGGLQPRVPQPAPALLDAKDAVSKLIAAWDDRLADAIAADNLFLDESKDRRRADLDLLRSRHGTCRPTGRFEAENALRGEWRLACDRGEVSASVTLAPTMPPKVQHVSLRSALPLTGTLDDALKRTAAAMGTSAAPALEALLEGPAAGAARADIVAAAPWGACQVGRVLESDGVTRAYVRLACERGGLDAVLVVDAASGKITYLTIGPARDGSCLP